MGFDDSHAAINVCSTAIADLRFERRDEWWKRKETGIESIWSQGKFYLKTKESGTVWEGVCIFMFSNQKSLYYGDEPQPSVCKNAVYNLLTPFKLSPG